MLFLQIILNDKVHFVKEILVDDQDMSRSTSV